VFRWEGYGPTDGQPFRDPSDYPAISVAASGTHDTEPVAAWWNHASASERRLIDALPTIQRVTDGRGLIDRPYDPDVRDGLNEALFASGSSLLLLPVQDVFGWRDRINEPALVSDSNWTFRLPWPCDRMDESPEARDRQTMLRTWAKRYGRS